MLRKISFHNAPRKDFPDKSRLKKCLVDTLTQLGFQLSSLQYSFTDDEELRRMNAEYLNHDYYTDILTFDLSDNSGEIDGDIYISRDRVKENALNAGVNTEEEYCRVIAHGLLHLCGLKDKSKSEKDAMRMEENRLISVYYSNS